MNIGIDIDGVIQDCESFFRAEAEIFDIHNGNMGIRDATAVKVQDRMGWTKETFEKFVNEKMFPIMRVAPLLPCAKEVINWLKARGHRLIIVTARGTFSDVEIGIAKEVLANHGLEFDGYCFNAQDKLIPCREEKVDYMKQLLLREIEFRGEEVGIKFVRKYYPYYVNGFSGASKYRGQLVLANNLKEILSTLDSVLAFK